MNTTVTQWRYETSFHDTVSERRNGAEPCGTPLDTTAWLDLDMFAKEIWDLAQHHKEILKRRSPDHMYAVFESTHLIYSPHGHHLGKTDGPKILLRVHLVEWKPEPSGPLTYRDFVEDKREAVLTAAFSNIHVEITKILAPSTEIHDIIDYADPEFTDDTIAEKLEELETAQRRATALSRQRRHDMFCASIRGPT